MKNKNYILICLIFAFLGTFKLVGCGKSEGDIVFSYIDEKAFAIYQTNNLYSLLRSPISFDTYDSANTDCPSRSNNYVRFNVKFNRTPSGYNASDIFEIKSIKINNIDYKVNSRQGKTNKDIEILTVFQYNIESRVEKISSITYSQFDSVIGDNIDKIAELNYKFTPKTIPNWIDRFGPETKFDIVEQDTDDKRKNIRFSVETGIEYDSLIYNVNQQGVDYRQGEFKAIISEAEYAKTAIYKYESTGVLNMMTNDFIIVGYFKNGIKYYFSPIHILMW
ncbi:MAG: hypothetical protein J1F71_00085 [Clostridiales bacterium]|nr:hypothetical protein [Clostridiales bacterium]